MYRTAVVATLISLAASVSAAAGSLAGAWQSSSGAIIACDAARCEKVLPEYGMVVDTFDYRLVRGRLALTSLVSGLQHDLSLAWRDDGSAVVEGGGEQHFVLTPYDAPVPYQNYVEMPSAGLLSDVAQREEAPLRPHADWPDVPVTTAAR
ncbi:MAG: hypothetical protein AAF416_20255 [Pseudomonadota bacterium]